MQSEKGSEAKQAASFFFSWQQQAITKLKLVSDYLFHAVVKDQEQSPLTAALSKGWKGGMLQLAKR